MDPIRIIRNEDIEKVLIGVPKGHKHLRVCVKLKDNSVMILQEATIANILRAYVTVKTHPKIKAQELKMHVLGETSQKQGYALHQLLETSRNQEEIEEELRQFLAKST
ncbi:hypothetical protein IBX35_01520 [Candidatus Bathyarchaeota archaeon]|nr:hypothetical protein [Candidatus Bathyarchaeota archaeon]